MKDQIDKMRDQAQHAAFAGMAMQGLLANSIYLERNFLAHRENGGTFLDQLVDDSFKIADTVLARFEEREAKNESQVAQ